jgi:hypothetical protein
MEWIQIVINAVLVFLLGLFIKNYFPSYMDEKGKNLATKEDIQEITRKTEEVQKEFKEGFERFSSDLQFKYNFYFKQYSELYSKLYSIIIQSEYVRRFIFTVVIIFPMHFLISLLQLIGKIQAIINYIYFPTEIILCHIHHEINVRLFHCSVPPL